MKFIPQSLSQPALVSPKSESSAELRCLMVV